MDKVIKNITNIGKEISEDIREVIKERFFSPMYFYFLMSWIITNWKFVFALLFVDIKDIEGSKLDFLISFYPVNDWVVLWTISKLVLIPAFSSFVFVWLFSQLSEKFYKRNETFKMNMEAIKRGLVYQFKRDQKVEDIKLRKLEVEKQVVGYKDNEVFNSDYDDDNEDVNLSGSPFLRSELLYNSDYDLYIESLNEFKEKNN